MSIEGNYLLFLVCYPFQTLHSRVNHSRPASHGSPAPTETPKSNSSIHLMSAFGCQNFASKIVPHLVHLLKQLIHISNIFLGKFSLPASEMLCFYVIIQQERLFKVCTIYLSHFFTWFFSDPLSACVSAHSTFNSQPLTHSLVHLSLFALFTALCSLYPSFSRTECLVVVTHRPTACYTTPIQSCSLCVCSHLPTGRTVHNSAVKSLENVKHCTVCEFSQHL